MCSKLKVILGSLATAYAGVIPAAAPVAAPIIAAAPAAAPIIAAAPAAAPIIADGPVPVSTSKVVAAPALPSTSQFHTQDEFGNLAFGYANINSARQESGNTYGGRAGAYSYTDANGIVQTVNYVADGLGFRVAASNLPVAPLPIPAPEVALPIAPVFNPAPLVGPDPVTETPEVAEARAAHLAAQEEAAAAAAEAPEEESAE